jgi:N-acetylmuramoyl-L-alanine amidase
MKKVALVVGHKPSSRGAYNSTLDVREFDFNDKVVEAVEEELTFGWFDKVEPVVIYRDTYNGLPSKIDAENPDFIVSFHCNAFNKKAGGTEVLYYHKSKNGKKMADILQKHFLKELGLKDRGVIGKTAEDRGGYLLRYTKAPCVIAEPFFIDNDDEYSSVDFDKLVQAYANAIEEMADEF